MVTTLAQGLGGLMWLALAVPATLICVACGAARSGAMLEAREAIARGDCPQALASLGQVETFGTPTQAQQIEIAFLRAGCLAQTGQRAEAIGLYEYIAATAPDSQYGFRARALLAELRDGAATTQY